MKRKRGRCSESGQAILEAAVMLPVLLFVALAMIDMQWMVSTAASLNAIASETARCEAIGSLACSGATTPAAYAAQQAANVRLTAANLTIAAPPCSAQSCTVTLTYSYKALGAWFPQITISRIGTAAVAGKEE